MFHILSIFLVGVGILVGAIILNSVASMFGLMSWFTFLEQPGEAGLASYIWLFFGYPLGLGLIGYGMMRLLSLF